MKTQGILFTLFLILLSSGFTNAQTFNLKTTEEWEMYFTCTGEPDLITGVFEVHEIARIDKAIRFKWAKTKSITGEAVSQTTGEKFRINYIEKHDGLLPGTEPQKSIHLNMVGDQGTHLVMAIVLENRWTDNGLETVVVRIKEKCM